MEKSGIEILIQIDKHRDLKRIYLKMRVVIVPYVNEEKVKELKQWDLWGPFVMCLLLGL